ncbi:MAG: Eco57I restriction-modification methylase domain-containing protein [Bacteroidota bacterium]|nr:Eco57I restriction-modification methylase domain-containing protein [Bacteroidota bacterium]
MKLSIQPPKKSISKAFLKHRPLRFEIEKFKSNLLKLLEKIDEIEREENQKNHIRDFLLNTYYKDRYEVNTKDYKDLVIRTGKTNKDNVGVIIETKRPGSKNEMISAGNLNVKAFQELVLYYMHERVDEKNIDIKYCIATNINEWFVFDASLFEKYFYRNKEFVKQCEEWRRGQKVTADTNLFYNDIAKPFIDSIEDEIPVTHFDLRDYKEALESSDPEKQKNLIALYKLLSPNHLLRIPIADDSNKLDEKFYKELLHIIGLEESKIGSKTVIDRKEKEKRDAGSLLENIISKLCILDSADRVSDSTNFGETKDEKDFNIALELCITWINRILFLKLLEAQLIYYHKGSPSYEFLNKYKLKDFDEVFSLFHHVLAVPANERDTDVKKKFERVPYLNSTLFEISPLEKETINISSLNDSLTLDLIHNSILKDKQKNLKDLPFLEYLLKFLEAYDFAGEGPEDIQEDSKTLINASVLGKVFEKINGYKDGSIFTPGFITMYMCREAIRPAVMQKFKDKYNWSVENFDDLKNFIADKRNRNDIIEFNEVINSLKICDPAVGSGHFLVSSLNEIIAVKSELGIFADEFGTRISDYDITIEQDELIITDRQGDIFRYEVYAALSENVIKVRAESQRLQRTLFHEKQTIIENCLFGVDINPNSVKICMLRLWIELLKNAYYRPPPGPLLFKEGEHSGGAHIGKERELSSELETLPNIDINIKCGNSLISRFPLDANLAKFGQKEKNMIEQYSKSVKDYKNVRDRRKKKELEEIIRSLKNDIRTDISKKDPKLVRLNNLKGELDNLMNQSGLFEQTKKEQKDKAAQKKKLETEIAKLNKDVEDIKSNAIYKNAFEWRFEFPEVLNAEGEYEGFDVVIGNPPYGAEIPDREILKLLFPNSSIGQIDTYKYFIELSFRITETKGIITYITSDSYLEKKYFTDTRNILVLNSSMIRNIKLGDNIFDNINLPTSIFQVYKGNKINYYEFLNLSIYDSNIKKSEILLLNKNFITDIPEFEKSFVIKPSILRDIQCQKLIDIYDQVMGVKVYQIGKGKPKQTSFEIENNIFVSDKKDNNNYYPYISQGIERYLYNFKNEFINYGEWLAEPRKLKYFENPKLIIREIVNPRIYATYIEEEAVVKNIAAVIISRTEEYSLKYLLALLNSNLFTYYLFQQTPKSSNKSYPSFTSEIIKNIPIKDITLANQQPFINLVDKILESKKQGKDTTALEDEIDRMVYELYGLTEEEVRVVEGKS